MIIPISTYLNTPWLISSEAIVNMLPVIMAFIQGKQFDFSALDDKASNKPYVLSISGASMVNLSNTYDLENNDVPPNSIAIIPIQGLILPYKTMDLVKYIRLAEANPNVIAVVFLINTPGGTVFYLDIAAKEIASMTKYKVGFVMNVCASAGMWLASPMDKIVVCSVMDQLGSIGIMTNFMDFTKMLEKIGVTVKDVYATLSKRKNEEVRDMLDEKLAEEKRTEKIIGKLDKINTYFHDAISKNLSIPLESEVFEGAMYFAEQAIEFGLAHEINTFENTIMLTQRMGLTNSINNYIKSNK